MVMPSTIIQVQFKKIFVKTIKIHNIKLKTEQTAIVFAQGEDGYNMV